MLKRIAEELTENLAKILAPAPDPNPCTVFKLLLIINVMLILTHEL